MGLLYSIRCVITCACWRLGTLSGNFQRSLVLLFGSNSGHMDVASICEFFCLHPLRPALFWPVSADSQVSPSNGEPVAFSGMPHRLHLPIVGLVDRCFSPENTLVLSPTSVMHLFVLDRSATPFWPLVAKSCGRFGATWNFCLQGKILSELFPRIARSVTGGLNVPESRNFRSKIESHRGRNNVLQSI